MRVALRGFSLPFLLHYLITAAILAAIGYALKIAWEAGYWYAPLVLAAVTYAGIWLHSTDEERKTFIDDVKRLVRWRG